MRSMSPLRVLSLTLLLFVAACNEAIEPVPKVEVTLEMSAWPADSSTRLPVQVRVHPDNFSPRVVTIRSTTGTFPGATESSVTTVALNRDGEATVLMRPPSRADRGLISAFAGRGSGTADVSFVALAPGEIIASLTTSPDAPAADGESRIAITATLTETARQYYREVTFSAPDGEFIGATSGLNSIRVPVDEQGRAQAFLKAPSSPGEMLITVQTGTSVMTSTVMFVAAPPALDSIRALVRTLPADGASTTFLRVFRRAQAPPSTTVTVSTTSGTLLPSGEKSVSGIGFTPAGDAYVALRASQEPGNVLVTASRAAEAVTDVIEFVVAHPHRLILRTGVGELPNTSTGGLELTAQLQREIGVVTPGRAVAFTAERASGETVGRFSNPPLSDISGVVKVQWFPAGTAYTGPVTLTATTTGADGFDRSASIVIQLTADEGT